MNPDVFITIAFAGIAVLVPLVFLVFVVPRIRRENEGVKRRESRRRAENAAPARSASDQPRSRTNPVR